MDKLGGLKTPSRTWPARQEDYEVRVLPRSRRQLFSDLGGEEEKGEAGRIRLAHGGPTPPHLAAKLRQGTGARKIFRSGPAYLKASTRERVAAVKAALLRLSLVQQEGVMMAMPIEIRRVVRTDHRL